MSSADALPPPPPADAPPPRSGITERLRTPAPRREIEEGALDQAISRLELAIGSVQPESLRKDLLLDVRALRLESWRPTALPARTKARLRTLARHPELAEACAGIERTLGS